MATIATELVEIARLFTDIALSDPLSAVLLAAGVVITGGSVLAIGYLALGALVDVLIPSSLGRTPPGEG